MTQVQGLTITGTLEFAMVRAAGVSVPTGYRWAGRAHSARVSEPCERISSNQDTREYDLHRYSSRSLVVLGNRVANPDDCWMRVLGHPAARKMRQCDLYQVADEDAVTGRRRIYLIDIGSRGADHSPSKGLSSLIRMCPSGCFLTEGVDWEEYICLAVSTRRLPRVRRGGSRQMTRGHSRRARERDEKPTMLFVPPDMAKTRATTGCERKWRGRRRGLSIDRDSLDNIVDRPVRLRIIRCCHLSLFFGAR
jgi:hypothetical protein